MILKMTSVYVLLLVIIIPNLVHSRSPPRIGIIGGGIGGTSCAYFMRELFQNKVSITLFERDTIGGRLRLMDVDGQEYEAGGSVIHPRNQYMVQFSKLLDLGLHQPQDRRLGIYNGEKFVFEDSDWFIVTMTKFIFRYGLSMFYLFKDVNSVLDDFSRIYDVQQKGYSFTSVDKLLDSMNPLFKEMSSYSLADCLKKKGYSGKFLSEFVQSVMMVNYGQTNNISAFAGYVSLAGAESNLWSIEGGNKLVPEGLLKWSESNIVPDTVSEIERLSDDTFSVKYQNTRSGQLEARNFDVVVLSVPLMKGNNVIKFVNFTKDFHQFERAYHQTVTTFVQGDINPLSFNRNSVPHEILTNINGLPFNSIGEALPISGVENPVDKKTYKIFSQKSLNERVIKKLFKDVNLVKEKVWLAYPHYKPPEEFVPFVLHPGLYYTNAIELSASAMEMSAIAAKNIALLVFNDWKNAVDKIDPVKVVLKDEL